MKDVQEEVTVDHVCITGSDIELVEQCKFTETATSLMTGGDRAFQTAFQTSTYMELPTTQFSISHISLLQYGPVVLERHHLI